MNPFFDTRDLSDDEIKTAFIKCFLSREGKIVLSFLNRITLERYLGPDSSSDELRHLEGQRHLVSYIKTLSDNK